MKKKIALAADHAGFEEKERLKKTLDEIGVEYEDLGTFSTDSVDYPDYAKKVGDAVASGEVEQGIIVCGSGIGVAIAANKVHGVRAAQAWNEETARLARCSSRVGSPPPSRAARRALSCHPSPRRHWRQGLPQRRCRSPSSTRSAAHLYGRNSASSAPSTSRALPPRRQPLAIDSFSSTNMATSASLTSRR